MADLMRVGFWIVFLAAAAGVMVAAFQGPQEFETERDETHGVRGITGQRQAIEFSIARDKSVRHLEVDLYAHCSGGGGEVKTAWYPSYEVPAPFERRGGRLHLSERDHARYAHGRTGSTVTRMVARMTPSGLEGRLRSVLRYERHGKEYMVCDTGFVPFAAGPGARRRVERIPPAGEPWSVYPEGLEGIAPISPQQRLFAGRLDSVCLRTWRERPLTRTYGAFVRWHAGQLAALRSIGRPPEAWASHALWLTNFERRVELERRELRAIRRGDFDAAARLAATAATLKAQGNVAGFGFGLRTCTSNGPTGAPTTPPDVRRPAGPPAEAIAA